MEATLLVLAAGMGSRYGGLKQMDGVGPSGETLLDYSVFDAIRSGYNRVVFVIRRDFEEEFRERVGNRFEDHIDVGYVFQQLNDLPPGFSVPEDRSKPWGTGHAIWCAREAVDAPFLAINADDFYGRSAIADVGAFLARLDPDSTEFCMAGYRLDTTLSSHGTVSRGVCGMDATGFLQSVKEHTLIARDQNGIGDDIDADIDAEQRGDFLSETGVGVGQQHVGHENAQPLRGGPPPVTGIDAPRAAERRHQRRRQVGTVPCRPPNRSSRFGTCQVV